MRFVARVLVATIVPSLAVAQTGGRSNLPSAAANASLARDTSSGAAHPTAPRVLVVDGPAQASTSGHTEPTLLSVAIDSLDTSGLVAALCARATAAPSVTHVAQQAGQPTAPAPHDESPHGESHHDGEPSAPAGPVEPQLDVHLFADIKFSATDSVGSKNGFSLGQFDLFAHSQLSDNLSVLTEATLTALPRNTYNAKLERLLLTFAPSNHFSAAFGRFHTGIGFYNTAYHHGTWFQTTVGRPLIFAIDGDIGVVPIHTLGISTTGEIPSGPLGLRYVAEVGTGRAGQSSAAVSPQPSLNDNNTPSFNVALIARPDLLDGLQFGVS